MNLYFRVIAVIIGAFFKSRGGIGKVFHLRSCVWPFDLDFNLHMTNSRYFALADLGRLDLILRSGTWRTMRADRLGVVLGGTSIRFRRALRPFERFTLSTEILGWDERWIYIRQIFTGRRAVACIAVMRAGFTQNGSLVPPQKVIDATAPASEKLQPPAWVQKWNDLETEYVADIGRA